MHCGAQIGLMRFVRSYWWFGILFQEKVHPFFKQQSLSLADDLKDVVVPGLKTFSKFLLRLPPVRHTSRFLATLSRAITVSHPPELRSTALIQNSIMFTRSCHSSPLA